MNNLNQTYEEKIYGIVVVRPGDDRRIFGRVRRSTTGDVYAIWAEDESPSNLAQGSNPHASYHSNGQLHSKSYDRRAITKNLQRPNRQFVGNQPIEATNADRAASPTLPLIAGAFDDVFELPLNLMTENPNRCITVDVVEPGIEPVRATGRDRVIAEKTFKDDTPWIVVSLVESPTNF